MSNVSSVKSGEILRISRGQYSFLCIHCGFNFMDVLEILNHIESHFDATDSETDTIEDTKNLTTMPEFSDMLKTQLAEMDTKVVFSEMPEIKIEVDRVEPEAATKSIISMNHKETSAAVRVKKSRRKKQVESRISDEIDENSVQCPVCESNCDNSMAYKNHLRTVHYMFGNIYQCYICGLYCRNLTALKRHISSTTLHKKQVSNKCYQCESKPPITNETDARQHKCLFCKQWYPNHLEFRVHFKNEHNQDVDTFFSNKENCKEFTCYICKKDFALKYYLNNHMIIHNENKAFVCDFCGKRYRTNAVLRRHLNVHEGKTYRCDECGKTFGYYARLRIHRYSHRTELNYKCEVCSKAFKVQKYLARHMVTHRDEKKFACRYCGKRFTFSTGRRAHEISQHNAV